MNRQPPTSVPWPISKLDKRPVMVALAGPNGAGKSTFYESHLKNSGLRFLNVDILARDLGLDAYTAADAAAHLRHELVSQRESFIFETVLSDPVGEKVAFLKQAAQSGYSVVVCFIGVADTDISGERVAMRVTQGGHDVPADKLIARFPRTLKNLQRAIRELPCIFIFDNSDMRQPFRLVAIYQNGQRTMAYSPMPAWLVKALKNQSPSTK